VNLALDGRTGICHTKGERGRAGSFVDGSKAGGMWETRGGLWIFSKCAQLPIFSHPVYIMGETLAQYQLLGCVRRERKERVELYEWRESLVSNPIRRVFHCFMQSTLVQQV